MDNEEELPILTIKPNEVISLPLEEIYQKHLDLASEVEEDNVFVCES